MTTSVLNRELPQEEATHPIPEHGTVYSPLPNSEKDGWVMASTVQTIQGDPKALYDLWSDVSFFPRWQEHVVSVTETGPGTSHWVMGNPEDPDGKRFEFDSRITESVPGEKISWTSTQGDVEQNGTVTFATTRSGRGTLVTLTQNMKIPLGSTRQRSRRLSQAKPAANCHRGPAPLQAAR